MELQGIFLDMYGTLTAGDRAAVEAVCRRIVDDHTLPFAAHELAVDWGNRFFTAIETANGPDFLTLFELERKTLVDTLAAHHVALNPDPYCEQLRGYWRNPPLHAEVLDALANLRPPVFIVSNADRADIVATLDRHNLQRIPFITSECARSYKPHAGVFRQALDRTGWSPSRVMHVGDSLHSDVGGAKPLGLRTGWLCRDDRIHDVGEETPDEVFRSLTDLVHYAEARAAVVRRP